MLQIRATFVSSGSLEIVSSFCTSCRYLASVMYLQFIALADRLRSILSQMNIDAHFQTHSNTYSHIIFWSHVLKTCSRTRYNKYVWEKNVLQVITTVRSRRLQKMITTLLLQKNHRAPENWTLIGPKLDRFLYHSLNWTTKIFRLLQAGKLSKHLYSFFGDGGTIFLLP